MRKRRWTRLLLLPLALLVALMVSAVHSLAIQRVEEPQDPPPPGITMATASGATVNFDEAGWGEPGTVDVEFQKNAAGELVAINFRDSDGNLVTSMTRDQAMTFLADSVNTMAKPGLMGNGTMNSTASGYTFSQPINSVFGATVTVNGDFTWR